MNHLLIKGARVVDPSQNMDQVCNVLVRDGIIAAVGSVDGDESCTVFDASGLVLAPGLVDMHVHLRDPGFTHKEDILSGCASAAAGGFTSIAAMPNTNPVCDNPDVIKYILGRAQDAKARVYPVAAITKGLKSQERTDLELLRQAGAIAISDDGLPVSDNKLMLEAMRAAQTLGMCVISHSEDLNITNKGIIHKGEVSEALGVAGVDRASEDCSTAGVIALAAASDTRIHIAHVSTEGAVALIRDAKRRGVKVTAESGPHYIALTHEKLRGRCADYRMAPPLREERDRRAVIEGIKDGTIDCIITDHAPHADYEKADFEKAPNGVIGLETSLAVCLTYLVHTGEITLNKLIEMMTVTPARILGIRAGTLQVGVPADIVLFDPNEQWVVDKHQMYSKSTNTCFDCEKVTGRVKYTMLNGKFTYRFNERREQA